MSCCAWCFPSMQNPVAYILGLCLVSKGLDISWNLSGLEGFRRLPFEICHGQTLVGSHLHLLVVKYPCDLSSPIILTHCSWAPGQLSMWLLMNSWKPILIWPMHGCETGHSALFTADCLPLCHLGSKTMLGALASTKDVRDLTRPWNWLIFCWP